MPIRADLLADIKDALGSSISPSLTTASAASDLFEAYVLCSVLRAAREEGATVTYETVNGNVPPVFIFRTSPGFISSITQDYTHAVIRFPDKPPLEGHIGVYISGRSKVRHEVDVAVLLRTEAEGCRRAGAVLPRHTKVLLAVECKFYTINVPLNLARSFLGLNRDINHKHGGHYFVINTYSPSGIQLIEEHKKMWEHEIFPNSTTAVTRLQNSFQTLFKSFKTSRYW